MAGFCETSLKVIFVTISEKSTLYLFAQVSLNGRLIVSQEGNLALLQPELSCRENLIANVRSFETDIFYPFFGSIPCMSPQFSSY